VNTIARSHIGTSSTKAGSLSAAAEEKKRKKYSSLSDTFIFTPIAVETLGPSGPGAIRFVGELGRRLPMITGDPRSGAFLKQKISMAVQRGNASCKIFSKFIVIASPTTRRGKKHLWPYEFHGYEKKILDMNF